MPVLTARLLGPPEIELDGRPLELSAGKARALFCYLLATRQVHSRDRLAGFFWPDVRERNALSSLRTALYDVRRSLGEASGYLFVERTRVAFRTDLPFALDVALLERASPEHGVADKAVLQSAVEAYRGSLLEGMSLPDAYDFDDWVFLERERLNNLYLSALVRLGDSLAGGGQWDRAVDMARRVLAVDPLREDVHRQLMRFLVQSGQRAAALAQYRACAGLLDRELGIAPLRATTELYERIAADEPFEPEVGGPAPVSRAAVTRLAVPALEPDRHWPMVGRRDQFAALSNAWQSALEARGSLALVSGAAGMGKSRLVAEMMALARDGDAACLIGRCHEASIHQPYGPIVEAIRSALAAAPSETLSLPEIWLRELARLVPEMASALPRGDNAPLDGVRDRDRLFESVRVLLDRLSAERPVLLVVEDLHWADETSMRLLSYLGTHIQGSKVLILTTYRAEDLGAGHRALVRDLFRAGRRVALAPLGPSDTVTLLESFGTGGTPPARFGQRVHVATGGNPLFIVESVRALLEQGTLQVTEGQWIIPAAGETDDYAGLPVPESVGLIVDSRLDRLSDDGRALIECAAVLRRDFTFDLVQSASNVPAQAALDGLDALVSLGLLGEVEAGLGAAARYDFSHALVRDRVYLNLSAARRQYLHRQAAGLMESALPPAPDRAAYHYLRGGVRDRACAWSAIAGDTAQRIYAFEAALGHYETARELAVTPAEEYRSLTGMGDAQLGLGRPQAAIASFRNALSAAPDTGSRADLLRRIGRAHERLGEFDRALDAYGEARRLMPGAPASTTAVRLLDGLATVYVRLGRESEAVGLCEESLAWIAENPAAPNVADAEAWVRNTLGMAQLQAGAYADATASLEQSLALKRRIADRLGEATLLNNLGVVHYHCGEDETARDHYAASFAIKDEIGDRYGAAIALANLALMETHLGRLDEAGDHLAMAEEWATDVGASWLMPEVYRVGAQRFLAMHQPDRALRSAEQALEAAEELGVPAFIGVAHRVLGQVKAAAFGDAVAAEEHLETSLAVFEMLADSHELAKTHAVLGEMLAAGGRSDAADRHLKLAVEVFRRSGALGRLSRIEPLLGDH